MELLTHKLQAPKFLAGRLARAAALSLALASALAGCFDTGDTTSPPDDTPPGPPVSRTLIIGLDGVTYSAIQAGLASNTLPNFAKMNVSLAYSGGVSSALTQQSNLHTPGWATLLTGKWANLHQVTSDVSGLAIQGGSMFEALKAKNTGSNGAAVASPNIASLLTSQRDADALDTLYDCSGNAAADDCVTQQTLALIDGAYTTVVAQYHAATNVARNYGTGSASYANAVKQLDDAIGTLLAEAAKKPNDKWLVVLTSAYGLSATGNADGLPLLPESTTFIALNQAFNDPRGVAAALPQTLDELHAYPSIADVTPTVLNWFDATPVAAAYSMYGSQLIGERAVSQLTVAPSTTNFNTPTANATLSWTAPPTGDINVMRDGETIAFLPAGTASYVDNSLRDYLVNLYPQGGTHAVGYVVRAGTGGALRAMQSAPLSYAPILASVASGLTVYYPFGNTLPPVDGKAASQLAAYASDLDPAAGTVVDGPFGENSHGLKVDLNYTDASNFEGYALTFNSGADPINAAAPVFSVGFWTKIPRDICVIGGDYPLLGNKNFKSGANPGFAMAIYSAASGTGCTLRTNVGDGTARRDSSAAITNNQWVYAAVTFDGPNNKVSWYVYDPVLGLRSGSYDTSAAGGAALDLTKVYTGPGSTLNLPSWGLGTDGTGQYYFNQTDANRPKRSVNGTATASRDYDASYTDLAFWNRPLTPAEVTSIYQSKMPLSSILH